MLRYFVQKFLSVQVNCLYGLEKLLPKTYRLTSNAAGSKSIIKNIKDMRIINYEEPMSVTKPAEFVSGEAKTSTFLKPSSKLLSIDWISRLERDGTQSVLSEFNKSKNLLSLNHLPKISQRWHQRRRFCGKPHMISSRMYGTKKSNCSAVKNLKTECKSKREGREGLLPLYHKKLVSDTDTKMEPRETVKAYPKFPNYASKCNSSKSRSSDCVTKKSTKESSSPCAIKKALKDTGQPAPGTSRVCEAEADGSNTPYLVKMRECKNKKIETRSVVEPCFSPTPHNPNCIVEFKDECMENLTLPRKSTTPIIKAEMNCCGACSVSKPRDTFTMKDLDNCHPNTSALKYRLTRLPNIDKMWCCPEEVKIPQPPKPLPRETPAPKPLKRLRERPGFLPTGEWKQQKFVFRHRTHKCPPRQPKNPRGPVCPPNPEEIRCDHCAPTPVTTLVTDVCATDVRPKITWCPPKRRPRKNSGDPCCNPRIKNYATKMAESRKSKPNSED